MDVEKNKTSDQGEQETIVELPGRPASVEQLIATMTPEIYDNLRSAVELGKWADGNRLTVAQREHCMEAIILYEASNIPESERTGAPLDQQCESKQEEAVRPLRFTNESET